MRRSTTPARPTSSGGGKVALLFAALLLAAPGVSHARSAYAQHIPNGDEFGCDNCHHQLPWLLPMGIDAGATLPMGQVEWSLLYDIDSDGDGQTNGFELGDPCGEWVFEGPDPSRLDDLANPSDPDSVVPDTVPAPQCAGDDDDSAAGDDDDSAGPTTEPCGYSLVPSSHPVGGLALLFGAAVISATWRRQRRGEEPRS